ncbi:MAG: indolepyruvate ferredoxin oxidoreductase subunit alpha [Clostridia bacterium]|nr:indolepyruvate ferredoxin oxidoreductase subunit alpha [Clostridia bacterium]
MKKMMLGNEAIARGLYESGVKVVSSYPGTPSTEITEFVAKYDEVYAEWAPNEKVAAEVAIGSAIAGARSAACMKHVGFNVAADPAFTASYTGTNAGLVFFVADDPGLHSSQNEQDTRRLAIGAKIPVLEPSDSTECKEFTKLAFELSEKFDTPIILRLSTRVAHSQSLVELCDREELSNKPYNKDPMKYVMMPGMAKVRHTYVEKRLKDMAEYAKTASFNRVEEGDPEMGIIASGIAYEYAKEAIPSASFLKLGLTYPLCAEQIKAFAASVKKVYVIEELEPVTEEFCKENGIEVIGKDILSVEGEYSTELIKKAILGIDDTVYTQDEQLPNRPPIMCPGCPHRGAHYVLKKLGVTVTGDIGCYTLGALPPMQSMDTCICMGASVSMVHGFGLADESFKNKTVGIIGDSTFIHSGITGLINMIYNKGAGTVIILDNSITGMTGHQQNPTTGYTLKGEPTNMINLEKLCEALGINRVRVEDPFDLVGFEKAVKEEIAADEPSVIISRRPCALLKEVKFPGPIAIDPAKCVNCKMCMKIGCPAIVLKDGKPSIDSTLCNGCGLCTRVCKPGAIG